MASLYKRGSIWWVKFKRAGIVQRESTGCRVGSGRDAIRARQICAERGIEEAREVVSGAGKDRLQVWVLNWLSERHAVSPLTLERYRSAWAFLCSFAESKGIIFAHQWTREFAMEFVTWRQGPMGGNASRNTAIADLRVLRLVLYEAMNRGLCTTNAAARLRLKPAPKKIKAEISEDEEKKIRDALYNKKHPAPEWMQISWEIAMHQGCRLAETSLPLADVNIENGEITFTVKRGVRLTTALHPELIPMMKKLQNEKRKLTWEFTRCRSRDWSRWLKRQGLGHLSFHCTRVTAITRMARAGVSQQQAMRFVGHSQEAVHAIYQRLRSQDLQACLSALGTRQ